MLWAARSGAVAALLPPDTESCSSAVMSGPPSLLEVAPCSSLPGLALCRAPSCSIGTSPQVGQSWKSLSLRGDVKESCREASLGCRVEQLLESLFPVYLLSEVPGDVVINGQPFCMCGASFIPPPPHPL